MIVGAGKKQKSLLLPNGKHIICRWKYVDVVFVLTFCYRLKYAIISDDRRLDQVVTKDQAQAIVPDGKLPGPNWWQKWSLLLILGNFVLSLIVLEALGIVRPLDVKCYDKADSSYGSDECVDYRVKKTLENLR